MTKYNNNDIRVASCHVRMMRTSVMWGLVGDRIKIAGGTQPTQTFLMFQTRLTVSSNTDHECIVHKLLGYYLYSMPLLMKNKEFISKLH